MAKVPYNNTLKERASLLRQTMTFAEKKIWFEFLRRLDIPINRQKVIDNYIVDFYCYKASLVIEIDGNTHFSDDEIQYDMIRTKKLESLGLNVIRYSNDAIITNFANCCEDILRIIEKNSGIDRIKLLKKKF